MMSDHHGCHPARRASALESSGKALVHSQSMYRAGHRATHRMLAVGRTDGTFLMGWQSQGAKMGLLLSVEIVRSKGREKSVGMFAV
jgi:hypothetical protein